MQNIQSKENNEICSEIINTFKNDKKKTSSKSCRFKKKIRKNKFLTVLCKNKQLD